MSAFRPNLVVSGVPACAEDSWAWLRLGRRVVMRVVGPCGRCSMVNVDQSEAQMGREPLLTLSKYRRERSNIMFGQFLSCEGFSEGCEEGGEGDDRKHDHLFQPREEMGAKKFFITDGKEESEEAERGLDVTTTGGFIWIGVDDVLEVSTGS